MMIVPFVIFLLIVVINKGGKQVSKPKYRYWSLNKINNYNINLIPKYQFI